MHQCSHCQGHAKSAACIMDEPFHVCMKVALAISLAVHCMYGDQVSDQLAGMNARSI